MDNVFSLFPWAQFSSALNPGYPLPSLNTDLQPNNIQEKHWEAHQGGMRSLCLCTCHCLAQDLMDQQCQGAEDQHWEFPAWINHSYIPSSGWEKRIVSNKLMEMGREQEN